jgi:hypothetical protein
MPIVLRKFIAVRTDTASLSTCSLLSKPVGSKRPSAWIATLCAVGLMALSYTASINAATTRTCPCTIWPATATPILAADPDRASVEVGVKFYADTNGSISGLRFFKSATNTGTHVGSLWTSAGALIGRATFVNESASGWQQVNFEAPVQINAGTHYVASYHTDSGQYADDVSYFTQNGFDNPPLHTLKDGTDGVNGVYVYSADSAFPTQGYISSNYWVDVVFTPTASAPPVAPTPPVTAPPAVPPPDTQPVGERGFSSGVVIHIGPGFCCGGAEWYSDRFTETKVNSFRMDFGWRWIEKLKGLFVIPPRLQYLDAFVLDAKAKGISPLLILDYGNPLYDGGGLPISDEAQTAFANYAAFVARHYKGAVTRYEVWNEWNIGLGTASRERGDPVAYARLLAKVYAALKAVDPNIVVIAGVTAGPDLNWTKQMIAAGGKDVMDAYSVHPYVYPNVPERALEHVESMESALKIATGRDVPIYVTEIGWSTYSGTQGVSQATAGDYVARLYLLAPMSRFIKGIWYYDIYDDGSDLTSLYDNFGLYARDHSPKPAACAMGEVNGLLAAYKPVSASQDARGVWVARFDNGTQSVFAVWTEERGATLNATISALAPSGAPIEARGICRSVSVTGNGSPLLRTVISNSPTLFTTIGDSLSIQ